VQDRENDEYKNGEGLYTIGLPSYYDSEDSEPADPYATHSDYDFDTDTICPRRR